MEKGSTRTEIYNDIFQDCWKTTLGGWRVPEGPGLGVDFSPTKNRTSSSTAIHRKRGSCHPKG
jgi:hypothetical protein